MRREDSSACLDDGHQASEVDLATAAEATPTEVDEEGVGLELQDGGEELAADPEVARLLSELQTELDDADGSDDSNTEDGGDEEGELEDGEDGENESGDGDSSHGCSEAARGEAESERRDAPSSPTAREQRSKERSLAGPAAESHPQTEPSRQDDGQERGKKIDISRMKIDAPHRCNRQRGGPRPSSAPSACLSAGGFSRLSSRASSSSRLSRAVSQKLLQAMKEKEAGEERAAALSEAQGRGGMEVEAALRQRSINVVKQNAEALQVRRACGAFFFQAGGMTMLRVFGRGVAHVESLHTNNLCCTFLVASLRRVCMQFYALWHNVGGSLGLEGVCLRFPSSMAYRPCNKTPVVVFVQPKRITGT